MAMHNETLNELNQYYQSLLAKSTLTMTEEEKQAHGDLINKISQDISEMRTEGISTLNDLLNKQKENAMNATENLSPAANDSIYSSLIESVGKSMEMLSSFISLPY